MKGGQCNIDMTKDECRFFLRMARPFVKMYFYSKTYGLSQSAISRFINTDNDDMISDKTVNKMVDEIYNSCKLYVTLYDEKIA